MIFFVVLFSVTPEVSFPFLEIEIVDKFDVAKTFIFKSQPFFSSVIR